MQSDKDLRNWEANSTMDSDSKLVELVDWMNVFTQDNGIAFEIYENVDVGFVRVRAFKPTPGPEPEESISEVVMGLDGSGPDDEPLVQIVLDEDGESVYMSLNAPAIVAVVLNYRS